MHSQLHCFFMVNVQLWLNYSASAVILFMHLVVVINGLSATAPGDNEHEHHIFM